MTLPPLTSTQSTTPIKYWVSFCDGTQPALLMSQDEAIEASYNDPTAHFMTEDRLSGWRTADDFNFPPVPPNWTNEKCFSEVCQNIRRHKEDSVCPDCQKMINFMIKLADESEDFVTNQISLFYDFSEEELDRFKDVINWNLLSNNENINWSVSVIKLYKDDLFWGNDRYEISWSVKDPYDNLNQGLSCNKSLPWTNDLIDQFSSNWNWIQLSINKFIPWNKDLIEKYENEWDWDGLCSNPAVPWENLFNTLDSDKFSAGIDSEGDHTYFGGFSANTSIISKLVNVEEFLSREANWWFISLNEGIPWNEELIDRYIDRLYWDLFSKNKSIPWSESFAEKYKDYISWDHINLNEGLPWDKKLLDKYGSKKELLAKNKSLPWDKGLIRYIVDDISLWKNEKEEINDAISLNEGIHWTEELVNLFKEYIVWDVFSKNTSVEWSVELINIYFEKYSLDSLSKNSGVWKNIFSSSLSKGLLDNFVVQFAQLQESYQNVKYKYIIEMLIDDEYCGKNFDKPGKIEMTVCEICAKKSVVTARKGEEIQHGADLYETIEYIKMICTECLWEDVEKTIEWHDFYEDPRTPESNIDIYGEDGFETDDTFFPDSWDPS